jgi:hypothetical protein
MILIPPEGIPVRALCPVLGGSVVVRVATSLADPALVVVSCERFPGEAPRCDRACFPLDLVRRRPFASRARAKFD